MEESRSEHGADRGKTKQGGADDQNSTIDHRHCYLSMFDSSIILFFCCVVPSVHPLVLFLLVLWKGRKNI